MTPRRVDPATDLFGGPSRETLERERAMTSTELQDLLIDPLDGLAPVLGWDTLHVRPGMRKGGRWWTATTGSLADWPDLVLVRTRDRRLIFAELKSERGKTSKLTDGQERVLGILRGLEYDGDQAIGGPGLPVAVEVHVWRPSDLRDPIAESVIGRILR